MEKIKPFLVEGEFNYWREGGGGSCKSNWRTDILEDKPIEVMGEDEEIYSYLVVI